MNSYRDMQQCEQMIDDNSIMWWWFDQVNILQWVQGAPIESLLFQMAVTLKQCISDPNLIKPKCVRKMVVFSMFDFFLHFSGVSLQFKFCFSNAFWLY